MHCSYLHENDIQTSKGHPPASQQRACQPAMTPAAAAPALVDGDESPHHGLSRALILPQRGRARLVSSDMECRRSGARSGRCAHASQAGAEGCLFLLHATRTRSRPSVGNPFVDDDDVLGDNVDPMSKRQRGLPRCASGSWRQSARGGSPELSGQGEAHMQPPGSRASVAHAPALAPPPPNPGGGGGLQQDTPRLVEGGWGVLK